MSTIDLSAPAEATQAAPLTLLDALPRRVSLTLTELQAAAQRAGGAPLPFELADTPDAGAGDLEDRLGVSRGTSEDQAYRAALAALHDPVTSLTRRGLLGDDDDLDAGIAGAVGLLAHPAVAVDLDVVVAGTHVRAWHRQSGEAVATLSTADGIVFELAWMASTAWADELARVTSLPEEITPRPSQVPTALDLPFELADGAAEAIAAGRSDLLPVLADQFSGRVLDGDGGVVTDAAVATALGALTGEAQGRLRVLVADVTAESTTVVGVRSWTLLADGWRSLRPYRDDTDARVRVEPVEPVDLAADLAPVLSQVRTEAVA